MSTPDIYWVGVSGKKYGYWIYRIETEFKEVPGNYIFAKKVDEEKWTPIYIGETRNLNQRLENHEKAERAILNGATHIHAHTSSGSKAICLDEETDLIDRWDPVCNG